jgi:hypothetical protein
VNGQAACVCAHRASGLVQRMTFCGGQRDALTTAGLKENTDATRARPQQRRVNRHFRDACRNDGRTGQRLVKEIKQDRMSLESARDLQVSDAASIRLRHRSHSEGTDHRLRLHT